MQVFKNKFFSKWAASEKILDGQLKATIDEMNDGRYEVNLGGFLYKKRLPRQGQGKSGGFRTLVIFKKGDLAFFVYGFAKNNRANINMRERETYKKLAKYYLSLNNEELAILIRNKEIIEVK